MKPQLPAVKNAVVLPAYNTNILRAILGMKLEEKPVSVLHDNEVLIKIIAASCNPSDIAFLRGGYAITKSMPTVPGFEGAGIVIAAGDGVKSMLSKKVSCFTQEDNDGTWAEYLITKASNCIILKEEMPDEQAAYFAINPFTAYGLFEQAQQNGSKAIIQNAAGSQVGNYICSLASLNEVEVINVVRKKELAEELKDQGVKHVLCSISEDFPEKLKILAHELNATTALDAVAGEQTGIVFGAMPANSDLIVYGGLSGKPISGIEILDIIFNNKKITGFDLRKYVAEKGPEAFLKISDELQDMFIKGALKTEIQGVYKLEDFVQGLKAYLGNMSGGKVLFKP